MKNFKAISRSLRLITAGMLTCAVAFTAAAGFCPSRVNGDSIKRTAVDRHNYMTEWFCSAPLMSYIVSLDDGGYMVFYVKADIMYSENGYDVEYYDSSFNFVKYKHIDSELHFFGAFYSDSTGYYVLTSQENPETSAAVECCRLTKYDKDWNRVEVQVLHHPANTWLSARITLCIPYMTGPSIRLILLLLSTLPR